MASARACRARETSDIGSADDSSFDHLAPHLQVLTREDQEEISRAIALGHLAALIALAEVVIANGERLHVGAIVTSVDRHYAEHGHRLRFGCCLPTHTDELRRDGTA